MILAALFGCESKSDSSVYADNIAFKNFSIGIKLPTTPVNRIESDTTSHRFIRKTITYKLDTVIDVELTCTKYLKDTPMPLFKYLEGILSVYDDQWRKYCVDSVMSSNQNGLEKLYYEIAMEDFNKRQGYQQRELDSKYVYSFSKDSTIIDFVINVHTNRPYLVRSTIDKIGKGIQVLASK